MNTVMDKATIDAMGPIVDRNSTDVTIVVIYDNSCDMSTE